MNSAEETSTDLLEEILELARSLAITAGKRALEMRESGLLTQDYKQSVELVTSADLAVSQLIEKGIRTRYPNHAFFTEESEGAAERRPDLLEPTWIIDPIDGTVGYARGHFQFCISIAFCMKGKIQVGVVYCPALDELFTSTKGNGAFLNEKPIRVSSTENLQNSLVATGFPHGWDGIDRLVSRLGEVRRRCRDVRRSGSAAFDLVWVACGRIDAYYEEDTKAWDISAGKLIAIEAGAECGFFDDNLKNELSEIRGYATLTANPSVFPELMAILDTRSRED
ncbi:MAG TPA: inositol monophosphatase [Opitutae bacterium]|nr:inositol monophosphatase [Opitutae bacterium]